MKAIANFIGLSATRFVIIGLVSIMACLGFIMLMWFPSFWTELLNHD